MMRRKIKKKNVFIFLIFVIFLVVGFFGYSFILKIINGDKDKLIININGDNDIILKYNEEYNDLGATAKYESIDLTDKIEVVNNLDTSKVGTYKYTYKVKYKKIEKSIDRTIKVVDDKAPIIKLNGRKNISIGLGGKYVEYGASAIDEYDGDLSNLIVVDSSSVDTNKEGSYKVKYSVNDSSGNKIDVERVVNVTKNKAEKIAVLNYHFFYKNETDICHESICLQIDKFNEQLDYLKNNGYYTVTTEEFVDWMYNETELPEKSVFLTIDDGAFGTAKDRGNYLIPALEEHDMYATLFLITDWWPIEYYKSDNLDVESHTHDLHYEYRKYCEHRSKVNCVSYNDLVTDLKKSIDVVKKKEAFCFPFYESTEQSIKAVKEVGFKTAFVGGNRKATRNDNKYKIPRYPIYDSTSLKTFIGYIS